MGAVCEYCCCQTTDVGDQCSGNSLTGGKCGLHAVVTPSYSVIGDTVSAQATITGATDPDTAIEVVVPNGNASNLQVLINDAPADPADYRTVGNAIRVRVGASPSSAEVQYTINYPVSTTTTTTVAPTTTTIFGCATQPRLLQFGRQPQPRRLRQQLPYRHPAARALLLYRQIREQPLM